MGGSNSSRGRETTWVVSHALRRQKCVLTEALSVASGHRANSRLARVKFTRNILLRIALLLETRSWSRIRGNVETKQDSSLLRLSKADGGYQGTITGTALLGPTCPVERIPPDPNCADRPFETELVLVDGNEKFVRVFSTNNEGMFSISVAPGTYGIRSASENILPRCSSAPIEIKAGETIEANISCDSGVR